MEVEVAGACQERGHSEKDRLNSEDLGSSVKENVIVVGSKL